MKYIHIIFIIQQNGGLKHCSIVNCSQIIIHCSCIIEGNFELNYLYTFVRHQNNFIL